MEIGYVVNEATTEYFYFVIDPEKIENLSIGGVLKVFIQDTPYFAIIENLYSIALEEDRLFDYEAIDYLYGKIKKPRYLLKGKAIFIGKIENNLVLQRKPQIPPKPGDKIYLPTDEEINKLYSFEDKKGSIPLGKLIIGKREYIVSLRIKELIIRHTGIFGITGSGKSTTVAHIIKELINRNIPLIIFDVHRDYIASFDNAIILTFDKREEEYIRSILLEKGRESVVHTVKFKPNIIHEYMEEITGISGKHAVHVYKLLKLLLSKGPESMEDILNWLELKGTNKEAIGIVRKFQEKNPTAVESLKSRIFRIKDWRLFRRTLMDYGDDLLSYIDKLLDTLRSDTMDFEISEISDEGEVILTGKNKKYNLIIVDLYPLSIEEQKILLDILLEKIYEKYKRWKFEGKADILGLIIEESHRFASKDSRVSSKISLIAREGRKFGLGLFLVTQIPSKIQEDIVSQINTFILLKIINPRDLDFIRKTCPYLSRGYFEALTRLETGKGLVVGLAPKNPAIIEIIRDVYVGGTEEDIEKRLYERIEEAFKSRP